MPASRALPITASASAGLVTTTKPTPMLNVRNISDSGTAPARPSWANRFGTRQLDFSWNGRRISQAEVYFVGRLSTVFPEEEVEVGGAEAEFFEGARWASLADLAAWPPEAIMAPRRLPELLIPILAGDLPPAPIDAGA